MRSRKSFVKKLLLSSATAFSLVGFASPAVFAWGGGSDYYSNSYSNSNYSSYDNDMNYNYGGGNNYGCMRYSNYNGWDGSYGNQYCMSHMKHYYHNYQYGNLCDHQY